MTLEEKILEIIKNESIKSDIRQFTCINDFGYSQFERNLAKNILSICQQEIDEAKPKWISVKDRLPEEMGRYWCYIEEQNSLGKSHYQWNVFYDNETKQFLEALRTVNVTHWMPLPKSPKESE